MTLDEQLDKLGSEFRIEMEKNRQTYFIDALIKLTDVFKCTKMVNELSEVFPMIKFLETFYMAGFYKGLSYGIDAVDKMVVDDVDIPIKYANEVSDEINQKILDGTFGKNENYENYDDYIEELNGEYEDKNIYD